MQQFNIFLKNEKIRQYDRMALLIILLHLALFSFIAISSSIKGIRIGGFGSIILLTICLAIDYFLQRIKNNEDTPYKMAALFIISMTWLQMGNWWIFGLSSLISLLYQIAKRELLVNVNKERIIYPSILSKRINWADLNTVILKDGLLTINLINDEFFQQLVDETKTKLDEKEFNDFCRQQLQSAVVLN